jgi:uncharacterized membrane protein YbhN (UPF0104 family)
LRLLYRRPTRRPLLKRLATSNIVKSILAIVLLAYLVYLVDFREIQATARTADFRFMLAAILLLPLNVFIEGGLWHRISALVVREPSKRASYGSLMCGYALGFFTPGRLGELAGRSFYLDHRDKWGLSALVMFQRMIDMLVGVVIGLIALAIFMFYASPNPAVLWWLILATGVVTVPALGFVLFRPTPAFRILTRIIRKRSILAPIAFLRRVEMKHVWPLLVLATLRYFTFVGQFTLLVFAFGGSGAILAACLGAGMTFYGKYLIPSVTIMDIGVREGSAVFFMGAAGIAQAAAFNASLFLFVINLVVPAAIGIPFVMRMRVAKSKRQVVAAVVEKSPELSEVR